MKTEITLPVPELKQALTGLNKLIGRKTTLPVLGCVRVSRQQNGLVTLQATDLDAHATFTLNNTQAGEPMDILVPMEQLNKAFKCSTSSKQDVVVVCEGKTTKLRYCIGNNPVHQPVNTLPVDEWPPVTEITVDSVPVQPGFGEALKQAMQCCSEDEGRAVLRGACLDARDKAGHYIVGTNGRFLFSANSFTFPLKEAVIIPDSKFINGSGLLDGEPCFLAVQPGKKPADVKHICLQNKQWQFVTRAIEGDYPNWKQCVPTVGNGWTLVKLGPTAIEEMLKVIPNLPGNDDDKPVRLRVDSNGLWVEGKNKEDKDWTKVAISDITVTGKAKEILLCRDYLLSALKFGLSELAIETELKPMVCSKEGKRIVIMPLNPHGPQATNPPAPKPVKAALEKPSTTTNQERKTDMPPKTEPEVQPESSFKQAMQQVDQLREQLKTVLRDLAAITETLKTAEKDKKASDKELEAFRDKLREIQGIKL
jgi:DNA polymerase III sliding clamp (beta) subunit (PCNA family)